MAKRTKRDQAASTPHDPDAPINIFPGGLTVVEAEYDQDGQDAELVATADPHPAAHGGRKVGRYAEILELMLGGWKKGGHPHYDLPIKTLANRIRIAWSDEERRCKLPSSDSTLRSRIKMIRAKLNGASD